METQVSKQNESKRVATSLSHKGGAGGGGGGVGGLVQRVCCHGNAECSRAPAEPRARRQVPSVPAQPPGTAAIHLANELVDSLSCRAPNRRC